MKMSKYSTLLRLLALVLSLMLLCGTLPVSALDYDIAETAETTAEETQAPSEEPTTQEPTGEPVESTELPSEVNTGSTEPTTTPIEEPRTDFIEIEPADMDSDPITYAASSLQKIEVTIYKSSEDDVDKLSVALAPRGDYTDSMLDDDNLIAKDPDWVSVGYNVDYYKVTLNLQNTTAPELEDGEYTIAVRDGQGNVETMDILLLTKNPTVSFSTVSSDWTAQPVAVYAYVDNISTDYISGVTYADSKGTHDAVYDSNQHAYKAVISDYSAAGRYTFTAEDLAGNKGSSTLNQEIKIDTHAPELSLVKYTDGSEEISPDSTFLSQSATVYAVVKAEDKDGDKPQSGINPESIELNGKAADVTEDDGNYRIKLSDPTAENKITIKDKAKNPSNELKTDPFSIDNTAPVQSDMQVVFSRSKSLAEQFLQTLSFGLYTNDTLKMTVKVNKAGQSDIDAITVRNHGDVFDGGELTNDGYGVFSREYTLPFDTKEYALTVQAVDKAANESEEIGLSSIKTIYIEDNALEEGKALYEVVATNQAPILLKSTVNGGKGKVGGYYTTADGRQTVRLMVEDKVAGIESTDVYFGKSDEFEKTDNKYTKLPEKLTGESHTAILGEDEFAAKQLEDKISFSLPDNLESGDYTVLVMAKNYSGNTAPLRMDFKVDNTGPTISGAAKDPDSWTNKDIKVSFKVKDNFSSVGVDLKDIKVKNPDGGTMTVYADTEHEDTYYFTTKVNGTYTVSASDKLANPGEPLEITVSNHDNVGPSVQITSYTPEAIPVSENVDWSSEKVRVDFTASDNSNGSVNVSIDDGSVVHVEGNGAYWFEATANREYTITATDEAENPGSATTAMILYDNQKPEIEKVVFSTEEGNFKKFGIYDKKAITATVYVRSPGNAPITDIVLKDGSDPIDPNGKIKQDSEDSNLYSLSFPLAIKESPYDLSVTAKNRAKSAQTGKYSTTEKNIEDLNLFYADDETGKLVEEKYKTAFELVITDHKPAITFTDDIENYTSKPVETDETKKVFAGAGGGKLKAKVSDDLSGVEAIESVLFDGTDVTNHASFTIDPNKKETSVDVSYTFGEKLISGQHTFEIVAKNNAGNSITENNSITFFVDQTPPTGTYSAPEEWTNQPITVTLNINDDADELGFYSGIDEVKVDDGAVAISGGEGGVYTFVAKAREDYTVTMTDKLGNSDTFTVSDDDIWLDEAAPEIIPDDGNNFTYSSDEWVSESEGIDITFRLEDDLSGVDTSSITITGDINGKVYSGTAPGYVCNKDAETGVVSCTFHADKYQTYTVTVTDSVKEENQNMATFTTDKDNMPKVDTEKPVINSVTFESSASDRILNILSFGIYHNINIKMTVQATDAAPSAGIATITAEYNSSDKIEAQIMPESDPSGDTDVVAKRVFIIKTDSASYNPESIILQAVDKADYASETVNVAGTDKYVAYPNSESPVTAPVTDGFEIVASTEAPEITSGEVPKIEPIKLEGTGKNIVGDNVWFKGDKGGTEVQVSANITANVAKLHEIKVYLNQDEFGNDIDITKYVKNAGQITDYTAHSGTKETDRTISFTTGNLDCVKRASGGDAKNVVKIVAYGNNGEKTEATRTFYIDDTTPEITSVSFTSASTAADSILNILSFGLYSNKNINMTVSVVDDINGKPSSGVSDITKDGYDPIEGTEFEPTIVETEFKPTKDSTGESVNAERVFTYEISNTKYDPSMITLGVTDNVGNAPANVTVAQLNKDGKIYCKNSDIAKIFDESKFEIVATSQKPTVSSIDLTSDPKAYDDGSKVWYQGNNTNEVNMSFSVEDDLSKIHSVKAEINDIKINSIDKIYTNFENEAANTAGGNDEWVGDKETKLSFIANTAQTDVTDYLHRISTSAQANQFTVTAVNNSGISETVKSAPFYIDDAVPYITKFEFNGEGYSDVVADAEKGGLNPAGVVLTEYGFYFRETTNVTVTASDYVENTKMKGSGVNHIGFRIVDINGNTETYDVQAVNADDQATFRVDADFKGQIYAYAVDNVTNKGSEITPAGLIVESGDAHEQNSGAEIEFGQANYHGKDNNNIDLFSGDVTVTFTISDTISGLRDAYYTVTNGSQVVDFQEVNVSNSGTLDNNNWSIVDREAKTNLVTRMSLTDTISATSFNANNLVVTLYARDRAGYTIKTEKKCSIDITKPTIEIRFDPSDPVNTDSGNNYYSTTRTATITVTERNFNPADFDWSRMIAIEGTVPGYAPGADWSTSYSDYTDSSTHTATVTFADDGKYEVILNFTDMAGNKADQVDAGQFYVDKTVPTVSVSLNPDREYYSGTVVATVTIVEHNFNPDGKYLTLTPHYYEPDKTTVKSGPTLSGWSSGGDTHTATLTFSQDGMYSFDIAFKDMALNTAQPYTGKVFYVDQTKPVITFGEKVQDGHAYDIQVQPSFDVFDFNYAGAESVNYTLTRHLYDFATGKQNSVVVSNASVKADYIEGVIKQLFTYPLFDKTEDNDGVYVLSVSATDRAGNVSDPSSITFSVNCFGSVFLLASDETIQLAEKGYTSDAPDVMIKEINVNQLKEQTMTLSYNNSNKKLDDKKDYSITSSGGGDHWYEYLYRISSNLFEDEGSYTVTASSVDAKLGTVTTNRTVNTVDGDNAAHKNCPVSFVVDKTAPTVTISGVEENGAYSEAEREIQITCLDDNLDKNSFVLKINGETINVDPDDIDDSLVGQLDIKYTILASGQQTDYMVEAEAKDYAGVTGNNEVNKFTLSATWLTMFFHNTVAVIITSVVLAGLIGLAIFLLIKKRRKNAE